MCIRNSIRKYQFYKYRGKLRKTVLLLYFVCVCELWWKWGYYSKTKSLFINQQLDHHHFSLYDIRKYHLWGRQLNFLDTPSTLGDTWRSRQPYPIASQVKRIMISDSIERNRWCMTAVLPKLFGSLLVFEISGVPRSHFDLGRGRKLSFCRMFGTFFSNVTKPVEGHCILYIVVGFFALPIT